MKLAVTVGLPQTADAEQRGAMRGFGDRQFVHTDWSEAGKYRWPATGADGQSGVHRRE